MFVESCISTFRTTNKMESTQEQIAEGESVVRVLAAVLERLVGANSLLAQTDPGKVTKFHALKAPGIGIHQYLERYVVSALLCFCVLLGLYSVCGLWT